MSIVENKQTASETIEALRGALVKLKADHDALAKEYTNAKLNWAADHLESLANHKASQDKINAHWHKQMEDLKACHLRTIDQQTVALVANSGHTAVGRYN